MTHLHDLMNGLAVSPFTRPRPAAARASEMTPVPVTVALFRPGAAEPFATVPLDSFELRPHFREVKDPATGRVIVPSGPGGLTLAAVVPEDSR